MTEYLNFITQNFGPASLGSIGALIAVFLVIFFGEMGVPFPGIFQTVLLITGYGLAQGHVQLLPLLMVTTLGRQSGSAVVYWLARFWGTPLVNKWGKYFHLSQKRLEDSANKLRRWSPFAVALGRLTPGLLVPVSLTSGMTRLRYVYFALGVFFSAIVWDGTFITIGAIFGHAAQQLHLGYTFLYLLVGVVAAVCVAVVLVRFIIQRRRAAKESYKSQE